MLSEHDVEVIRCTKNLEALHRERIRLLAQRSQMIRESHATGVLSDGDVFHDVNSQLDLNKMLRNDLRAALIALGANNKAVRVLSDRLGGPQ